MSISKKQDSPYYYTRFSICGIRVQESTRTSIKSEAQRYEDKRRQEIREYVLHGGKPCRTWIEAKTRWLKEMMSKRTIREDISHFDWLQPHFDSLKLDEITKEVVERITNEKEKTGVRTATVNRLLALIRSVLNKAHKEWNWIKSVPHIRLKREDNARIRWLTRKEAEKLLAELPQHLRDMARFTLTTGLRASNVFNLKWIDINMEEKHIVIHADQNKTKKHLGVPLNDEAIGVLLSQIGKDDTYVFVYKKKPVTQCSTRAWRKALKRAGIKNFRWHDLRHTWASWHVQSGTTLQELCALGGWASFDMVLRYAHLSSNHLQAAADRISGAKMVKRVLRVVGEDE